MEKSNKKFVDATHLRKIIFEQIDSVLHGQLSFKILFCFILYFHRDISKLVSTVKLKQEFWDIRGDSEPYGLSCLFYEIFPRYNSQRSVLSYLRKVHQSYFLRSSRYRPLSVSGIIIIINTRPTSTSRGSGPSRGTFGYAACGFTWARGYGERKNIKDRSERYVVPPQSAEGEWSIGGTKGRINRRMGLSEVRPSVLSVIVLRRSER